MHPIQISVPIHITNEAFLTWMFLHHYGVQLKTAVEKEAAEKVNCDGSKVKNK